MQHLEVSCAVRPFFKSLGFKGLIQFNITFYIPVLRLMCRTHFALGLQTANNFSASVLRCTDCI